MSDNPAPKTPQVADPPGTIQGEIVRPKHGRILGRRTRSSASPRLNYTTTGGTGADIESGFGLQYRRPAATWDLRGQGPAGNPGDLRRESVGIADNGDL